MPFCVCVVVASTILLHVDSFGLSRIVVRSYGRTALTLGPLASYSHQFAPATDMTDLLKATVLQAFPPCLE